MRSPGYRSVDGQAAEAVCVSHQLPIYILRRFLEGQHLPHDPRHRECGLASVTSVTFIGPVAVEIDYAEPAAAIVREAVAGARRARSERRAAFPIGTRVGPITVAYWTGSYLADETLDGPCCA